MSTALPVAIYTRVSTDRQANRDLSLPAQRKALLDHAKKKGWTVVKEYTDEGESARTADRPQFQQMLTDAKRKQFVTVLVWKLDRFARNLRDLLNSTDELTKHGVTLESLNEPMEDSPAGRFGRNALAGVAELFSATLAADVRRGMRESASRGHWVASHIPIGYVKSGRSLAIDDDTAPTVRRIYDLYLKGYGTRSIATMLSTERTLDREWLQFKVLRILRNENYTGKLCWNVGTRKSRPIQGPSVRVPNAHPAIIDTATFDRVQLLLTERSNRGYHPRTIASRFLLSGFTECAHCGGAMMGRAVHLQWGGRKHEIRYYVCRWWHFPTVRRRCHAKAVRKEMVEQAVFAAVGAVFNDEKQLKKAVAALERLTREATTARKRATVDVDKQMQSAKARLDKLYDALETGRFQLEDLAPRIAEWRRKVAELEREKAGQEIAAPVVPAVDVHALAAEVKESVASFATMPPEESKQLLRSIIERIVLDAETVEIHWRLPLVPTRVGLPAVQHGPKPQKQRVS